MNDLGFQGGGGGDEIRRLLEELRRMVDAGRREHLSVEEAAAELKKAPFTVREWCRHGRMDAKKANDGRSWVIARGEIDRYRKEGLRPMPPV